MDIRGTWSTKIFGTPATEYRYRVPPGIMMMPVHCFLLMLEAINGSQDTVVLGSCNSESGS